MKRKMITAGFAVLLIAALAGCGRKKGTDPIKQAASTAKDHVYRLEELGQSSDETSEQRIQSLYKAGDKLYGSGYFWTKEGKGVLQVTELNQDGTVIAVHEIAPNENESIQSVTFDEEGNCYAVRIVFHYDEEEMPGDSEEYYLIRMTLEGDVLSEINLKEIPEVRKLSEENGYFFVESMVRSADGMLSVLCVGKVVRFNPDGSYAGMVTWADGGGMGGNYMQLADGRVVGTDYSSGGVQLAEVDFKTGTIGEKYKLPGNSYEYNFYPGIGYDIYLVNDYGVYGYNLGDEDKVQLLSYLDSDLGIQSLRDIVGWEKDQFFAIYDEVNGNGSGKIGKFTKVPPEEVKEKQIITLAMPYSNWGVRNMAAEFNKKNEAYRITILDYSSLYRTDDNWNAGLDQMNMDIASGKMPDIILLDNKMPVDSYRSKGLFEDLWPYIDRDKEFGSTDFMPNVMEAFSVKGKLYYLVPSYRVLTLFAKTSDVGDKREWTVQEARALLDSKPEGTGFMEPIARENVLDYCMNMASSQFIDWESGKCSFHSDAFIQMLEFAALFPEELNYEAMDDEYWNEYDVMWRNGIAVARTAMLGSFREYNEMEKVFFGEDVTMIGFPTAQGSGSVIYPDIQLVMSAKSKHQEGVWEFMRMFLTEDYQKTLTYTFPIRISQMENQIEEAMKNPTYEDEFGNQIEFDNTYFMGGVEVTVTPISREKADDLVAWLYGLKQVSKYDESLMNIIKEEAAPYFAGEKSAEDVAKIIQSRAQIYVNESR